MTVSESLHHEKMLNAHGGRLERSWKLTGKCVKKYEDALWIDTCILDTLCNRYGYWLVSSIVLILSFFYD